MVTIRSGRPRVAAVLAPPVAEPEDTVDGLRGDGDEPGSGVAPLRAHPTVNAMMATADTMTGEKRGRNLGQAGIVFTEPIAAHGYAQSLRLVLPALSCLCRGKGVAPVTHATPRRLNV